jgi:hypothetical protein
MFEDHNIPVSYGTPEQYRHTNPLGGDLSTSERTIEIISIGEL